MPSGRAVRAGSPTAVLAVAVLAVAGLALAACTNQQASINRRPHPGTATASIVGGEQQLTVTAGDTYRFYPSTIVVHPGQVKITLENIGKGAPHDLTFLSFPAGTALTQSGTSATVTFTAPSPGTYTFVCTIHRKQGQTGALVVLPG